MRKIFLLASLITSTYVAQPVFAGKADAYVRSSGNTATQPISHPQEAPPSPSVDPSKADDSSTIPTLTTGQAVGIAAASSAATSYLIGAGYVAKKKFKAKRNKIREARLHNWIDRGVQASGLTNSRKWNENAINYTNSLKEIAKKAVSAKTPEERAAHQMHLNAYELKINGKISQEHENLKKYFNYVINNPSTFTTPSKEIFITGDNEFFRQKRAQERPETRQRISEK